MIRVIIIAGTPPAWPLTGCQEAISLIDLGVVSYLQHAGVTSFLTIAVQV